MNRLLYGDPHPCERKLPEDPDEYYDEEAYMERYYEEKYG